MGIIIFYSIICLAMVAITIARWVGNDLAWQDGVIELCWVLSAWIWMIVAQVNKMKENK
jgi:hypothetical protein